MTYTKQKTRVLPKFAVRYSENALLKVGRVLAQDSRMGHLQGVRAGAPLVARFLHCSSAWPVTHQGSNTSLFLKEACLANLPAHPSQIHKGNNRIQKSVRPTVLCLVAQSCLTLCDPMDCSPPGSSVHGIIQARILEWVAVSSSRGPPQPRDQTHVSCVSCNGRHIFFFYH